MIKFTKKVSYYKNNKIIDVYEIEKKTFYTLEDALQHLDMTQLKYYINNKAISAIESAEVLEIKNNYGNNPDIKKYIKVVNIKTGKTCDSIKNLNGDEINP